MLQNKTIKLYMIEFWRQIAFYFLAKIKEDEVDLKQWNIVDIDGSTWTHRPLTCSFGNLPFGATLVESFKAMIDIMDIVHVTLAAQIIVGTI